MISICIKNNNNQIISYLSDRLFLSNINSMYISTHEFKHYKNIIIHYKSERLDFFYDKISSIITDTIIKYYENKLLNRILNYNYFYFTSAEKRKILDMSLEFIANDDISREDNYFSIYYSVLDYVSSNKSLVLDGFVNFRLQNYMKNLDYIIDISVNKFLIEKEYNEFISILKLYISMTPFNSSIIHLVYHNNESILLDRDMNVIQTEDNIFKAKYLSDISFSSNDYALNTLLNLTPKKLIIHLVDEHNDEFINTLKLIFENRYEICSDCTICNLYKKNLITTKK